MASLALAAIAATPLTGSATSLANSPFGVKALNSDGSGKYAIKGLKLGTDAVPGGNATEEPVTPAPTADPEPPADTDPYLVSMTIDTRMNGCTGSSFNLNVADKDLRDATAAPLPASGTIDWGDNTTTSPLQTLDNKHSYAKAGVYTLKVNGTLGGLTGTTTKNCISSIDHFGSKTGIVTLQELFKDAYNIKQVAAPPTTLQNAQSMFSNAVNFNGNTSDWRLPNLKYASAMFASATRFNGDLSRLNPQSLLSTGSMFARARSFNGDLTGWNMSKVTSVNQMFMYADSFNGDISSWDLSSAQNFNAMFQGATAFNRDISSWNMANATDTSYMFSSASSFNQPIGSWNTANVTTMNAMFSGATNFNQYIRSWDVKKVRVAAIFSTDSALASQNRPLFNSGVG